MGLFSRRGRKRGSQVVEAPTTTTAPPTSDQPGRGENLVTQRQVSDSQAIERELTELKERYETLTVRLKQQLLTDQERQQKQLEELGDRQAELQQQIRAVRSEQETQSQAEANQDRDLALAQRLNQQKLTRLQHDDERLTETIATHQQQLDTIREKLKTEFGTAFIAHPVKFDKAMSYFLFSADLVASLSDDMRRSMQAMMGFVSDGAQSALNVLTVNYNDNLPQIWDEYRRLGLVDQSAGLFNLYYTLQDKHPGHPDVPRVPKVAGTHAQRNAAGQVVALKNDQQQAVVEIQYRPSGEIWYVTYLDDGLAHHRDVYDVEGHLSVTQYLDQERHVRVVQELFYRSDDTVAIKKDYGADKSLQIQLLNQSEQPFKTFTSEIDFLMWWLTAVLGRQRSGLIIGIDSPLFASWLKQINSDLQVLPIVTAATLDSPFVAQILAGESPIKALLAADDDVYATLEKRLQVDLAISVVPSV